jgi:hypothetical protein
MPKEDAGLRARRDFFSGTEGEVLVWFKSKMLRKESFAPAPDQVICQRVVYN